MKYLFNRFPLLKAYIFIFTSLFIVAFSFLTDNPTIDGEIINEQIYKFKIGQFECVCINDGDHYYSLGDFFKNVPGGELNDVLKNHNLPTEIIYSPYTHLIVSTGEHKVLVDMGAGGNLYRNIKIAGINPTEIDFVIITHAHPDHIGGTLDDDGNPNYPNAQYYIWKDEWDFWFSEAAFEKTYESFINKAREQLGPVADRMNFVEENTEILPGIELISAKGHTPGHMIVHFKSNEDELYYTSDAVLNPLHLEFPDWLPIYDILPDEAAVSKKYVFNLVSQNNAWVIGQHFPPFPSLGKVEKIGSRWQWNPVIVDFPEIPKHEIKIVVTTKTMPESSTIYITGNDPEVGLWNPSKIPLVINDDSIWSGTFAIKKNKRLEFKITRGSWDTEAIGKEGKTLPNSVLDVTADTTMNIVVENWKDL